MPTPEMLAANRNLREALIAGTSFTQPEAMERFNVGVAALTNAVRKLEKEGRSFTKTSENGFARYQCTDCAPIGERQLHGPLVAEANGAPSPTPAFPYPIIGDRLEVDFIQRGKTKGTVDIGLKAPDGSTWLVQVVGRTT